MAYASFFKDAFGFDVKKNRKPKNRARVRACVVIVLSGQQSPPFRGQLTWNLSGLSPKRDCGSKRFSAVTGIGVVS